MDCSRVSGLFDTYAKVNQKVLGRFRLHHSYAAIILRINCKFLLLSINGINLDFIVK